MAEGEWCWDPSLYAGSAAYYARGRIAYPRMLGDQLRMALGLDGSGRLLDVGCGPGSLTLLLAPLFEQVTGIDADADMLAEAARLAELAAVRNVSWVHLRGEDLPGGLGTYRLVGFAQSFHWMDRMSVAAAVHGMIGTGGALVHVHATTHQGIGGDETTPHPQPPWSLITDLVRRYLGPVRRAGRGTLPAGTATDEDSVYRAVGFTGPRRLRIPGGLVTRTTAELVASVFSLSSSTPRLFGDRLVEFETELGQLLAEASPTGLFSERMREIAADVWTP